uniref:Uncharacterized protein n=1 Tax=Rhizophora mucronata TaxID=61149 RepID=A0A2P2NXL1_RHIMU
MFLLYNKSRENWILSKFWHAKFRRSPFIALLIYNS